MRLPDTVTGSRMTGEHSAELVAEEDGSRRRVWFSTTGAGPLDVEGTVDFFAARADEVVEIRDPKGKVLFTR